MVKERESRVRVHQLIQELAKKQSFKRTTITSAYKVVYDLTHWGDGRWELVSHGIYEMGTKSILRVLNAPPDVVALVQKRCRGFMSEEDVLGLMTQAKVLLHAAKPDSPLYK